jgi:hypothetical protein
MVNTTTTIAAAAVAVMVTITITIAAAPVAMVATATTTVFVAVKSLLWTYVQIEATNPCCFIVAFSVYECWQWWLKSLVC